MYTLSVGPRSGVANPPFDSTTTHICLSIFPPHYRHYTLPLPFHNRHNATQSKADHRTSTYTTPHLAKLRMHEMPLWLPKSYQDLNDLPSENIVYQPKLGGSKVVRTAPGVVIKYRGDLAEEVNCLNFARDHLSIRVPRVLHHPGDVRQSTLWDPRTEELPQVWYICMEEIQGVQLKEVIDSFTPLQLEHVASQIKAILADMHSVPAPHIGSVSGGPFQNSYFFPYAVKPQNAWTKVSDFIDHYHQLLMTFGTEEYAKELLANFPQDCPVNFTHGDLVPRNILVEGSTITGIVDWSMAGFYPEFWEYSRMYDDSEQSKGWSQVLSMIFPGPRLDNQIATFHRLMGTLLYNL